MEGKSGPKEPAPHAASPEPRRGTARSRPVLLQEVSEGPFGHVRAAPRSSALLAVLAPGQPFLGGVHRRVFDLLACAGHVMTLLLRGATPFVLRLPKPAPGPCQGKTIGALAMPGPRSFRADTTVDRRSGRLERGDVVRLHPLAALRRLVRDLGALLEGLEALAGYAGVVDEEVLAALVRGDEAVALLVAEPLHCSLGHRWPLLCLWGLHR